MENNYNSVAIEAKRTSEFDREGEKLNASISHLQKLIATVEEKISGILRPESPKVSDGDKVSESVNTNIGHFVREKTELVEGINRKIKDILNRAEI